MPLFAFTPEQITLNVSDRTFNDTVIKQKATFKALHHNQNDFATNVDIEVEITMYANDNGAYGAKLTGPGFHPYKKHLGADNNTIVNAQTGEILKIRNGESDAHWKLVAESFTESVMFQADFFVMLRDNSPIQIGDLIKHHIQAADALGRFA